jgi:hypothetical protein
MSTLRLSEASSNPRISKFKQLGGGQKISHTNPHDLASNVIIHDNSKKANLHVDSNDKVDGTYQKSFYSNKNKLVNKQIYNTGISEVDINYAIENINEDNNVFSFVVTNVGGSTIYTITLTPGNYETITTFTTELLLQMNTATNIFTVTAITNNSYTLNSTETFNFLPSIGIQNSDATGIFLSSLSTVYIFYPTLEYTRYLDFTISHIKNSIVTRPTFTSTKNYSEIEHFCRVHLDGTQGIEITHKVPRKIVKKYKHISYFPITSRDIEEFQISIFTEKGFPIYAPTQTIANDEYEIKKLVYSLDFSITS